jgi:DNA-binding FadR family transcriptional regulator
MTIIHQLREKPAPRTYAQHVVDELRELILNGSLKEGQQLRQDSLAAALKVSRIPMREALRQLEADGLVTFFPHKGAIVNAGVIMHRRPVQRCIRSAGKKAPAGAFLHFSVRRRDCRPADGHYYGWWLNRRSRVLTK